MSRNMLSSNSKYTNAMNEYQKAINQYTGNTGYQNSLQQAQLGANQQANMARGQAQAGARNAGMSKSQAAMAGTQAGANASQSAFANQQQQVAAMGNNQVQAQGSKLSAAQTEGQNEYNRAWGNVGAITGFLTSDENAKNVTVISDPVLKKLHMMDKNRYKKLKWENPECKGGK